MNILYISKYGSTSECGSETRHIYLSRELVKRGHKVCVVFSDSNHLYTRLPNERKQFIDGIEVHWLKTIKYANAFGLWRIFSWFHFEYKLYRQSSRFITKIPDVIIVSSLSLLTVLNGIRLKRKYGCILTFEVRDIWPKAIVLKNKSPILSPFIWMLKRVEQYGYKSADLIIGTMPNLSEHIEEVTGLKCNVMHIPHLINESIFYSRVNPYSSEIKLLKSKGKIIIAYAGTINESSSLNLLLDVVTDHRLCDRVEVVVIGDGPLKDQYSALYERAENIVFISKVAQVDLVAILNDCDVLYDGYLASSLYQYGSSRNKYIEYCLAKKPIIVTYSGYPLFVEIESCGFQSRPLDKEGLVSNILKVCSISEAERLKLGENAANYAKKRLRVANHVNNLLLQLNELSKN